MTPLPQIDSVLRRLFPTDVSNQLTTHPTQHYLLEHLQITNDSEMLNRQYRVFARVDPNHDNQSLQTFAQIVMAGKQIDYTRCGIANGHIFNTCHMGSTFSPNFLAVIFKYRHTVDDTANPFVLIRIYNGTNGNDTPILSEPYIFELNGTPESFLWDVSDVDLRLTNTASYSTQVRGKPSTNAVWNP